MARLTVLTPADISQALQTLISGVTATTVRDGTEAALAIVEDFICYEDPGGRERKLKIGSPATMSLEDGRGAVEKVQ
jgi:hypothetical protein